MLLLLGSRHSHAPSSVNVVAQAMPKKQVWVASDPRFQPRVDPALGKCQPVAAWNLVSGATWTQTTALFLNQLFVGWGCFRYVYIFRTRPLNNMAFSQWKVLQKRFSFSIYYTLTQMIDFIVIINTNWHVLELWNDSFWCGWSAITRLVCRPTWHLQWP